MKKLILLTLCCSASFANAAWTDKVKQFESPKENAICQAQRMYNQGGYTSVNTAKAYKSYRVSGMPRYLARLAFINSMNNDGIKSIRGIDNAETWLFYEALEGYTVFYDVIDKYTTDICIVQKD